MARHIQEGSSLRTVYDTQEKRRVCFYENLDHTFGFLEWRFSEEEDSWIITRVGAGSKLASLEDAFTEAKGRVSWLAEALRFPLAYQLGWTTLPGLRGLSVSEFRAIPTAAPDNEKGVAISFADEQNRDEFLRHLEEYFAQCRFTNAADAFDTVKAYVLDRAARQ